MDMPKLFWSSTAQAEGGCSSNVGIGEAAATKIQRKRKNGDPLADGTKEKEALALKKRPRTMVFDDFRGEKDHGVPKQFLHYPFDRCPQRNHQKYW